MNWYKKSQVDIYRGDANPIDLSEYDLAYGIKELGKDLGSSAALGPGIYFVTAKDIAEMYGSNITKKSINNANIITKQSRLFTKQQINKMLNEIDKEIIETAVSNWDENYSQGKSMLISSIMDADNAIDQLMNIWAEVFMRQNPYDFVNLMIKNGIDGISIDKDNETYYVIYNRKVLN